MFKSRRRIAEEEAKKQEDYIPTKDLKADETEEEKKNRYDIPWTGLIIAGVLLVLIAGCIVTVVLLGGPIK